MAIDAVRHGLRLRVDVANHFLKALNEAKGPGECSAGVLFRVRLVAFTSDAI